MAPPRIFVSSTFYDLKYVRADLRHLEREMGVDLVEFERAEIPYAGWQRLEESCRDEIERCDIVVCIIGGRYGSESEEDPLVSITRREVEHAVNNGRQLFVFVEHGVYSEFLTYLGNVERAATISWRSVDSPRVFEFLGYIRQLPSNNATFTFDTSEHLINQLRSQLIGLFQAILQQQRRGRVDANANRLVEAVEKLDRVVAFIAAERESEQKAVNDILLSRHPAFSELREAIGLPIRVIFEDELELDELLSHFGYRRVADKELTAEERDSYQFWAGNGQRVGVSRRLFVSDESGRSTVSASTENRPIDGYVIVR